jgi:hypothetical protein
MLYPKEYPNFLTVTCLDWKHLLTEDRFKNIITFNNPVKAGICQLPEDYKYSSASHYILNKSEWEFLSHYDG